MRAWVSRHNQSKFFAAPLLKFWTSDLKSLSQQLKLHPRMPTPRLNEALERGCPAAELPRIDVHPVIFRGTYDEHNWQVLLERWDDLRAQLHGEVIPAREAEGDLGYGEVANMSCSTASAGQMV